MQGSLGVGDAHASGKYTHNAMIRCRKSKMYPSIGKYTFKFKQYFIIKQPLFNNYKLGINL